MRPIQLAIIILLGALDIGAAFATVNCTVTGTVQVQPMDLFYCDTNPTGGPTQDCTGWREVNLDTTTKPLKYLKVVVRDPATSTQLSQAHTNSSGQYTVQFQLGAASCANQVVHVGYRWARVHESDGGLSDPRYRFRVTVLGSTTTRETTESLTLTGASTQNNRTFARSNDSDPDFLTVDLPNLYYTADSMISEVISWTSHLSADLATTDLGVGGMMRLGIDSTGGSGCSGGAGACALYDEFEVKLPSTIIGNGLLLRHEMSHLVFFSMLKRSWDLGCSSDLWANSGGRDFRSCEWGSHVTEEGTPTFIALRSVTSADTNSWICGMYWTSAVGNQDACSECRYLGLSNDKMVDCGTPSQADAFRGIGDSFATQKTDCARVQASMCSCTDSAPADGVCDSYQSIGWRNVVQAVRFFWDILDTSTDGGRDNTDMSMGGSGGLAEVFEDIPCVGGTNHGANHDCQECNVAGGGCTPAATSSSTPNPAAGTRDGFNLYDFSFFIPDGIDGQWDERDINCAAGALD